MPAPCICEQAGGVLCPGPDKWPRRVGRNENERGEARRRRAGGQAGPPPEIEIALKIGILMSKRADVPFRCVCLSHFDAHLLLLHPERVHICTAPLWGASRCRSDARGDRPPGPSICSDEDLWPSVEGPVVLDGQLSAGCRWRA